MAYGKYPFPFVELIQTLIHGTVVDSDLSPTKGSDVALPTSSTVFYSDSDSVYDGMSRTGDTPWLLASVLMLANNGLGKAV